MRMPQTVITLDGGVVMACEPRPLGGQQRRITCAFKYFLAAERIEAKSGVVVAARLAIVLGGQISGAAPRAIPFRPFGAKS